MGVEKIVVGRNRDDLAVWGQRGTAFIGKHIVGSGEESHLTSSVQMDVTRPHILLVCGKRGTGKSFTAGVVAEEIALLEPEVRNNLSVLIFDTMGIYWSMKQPNTRQLPLLKQWGLAPKGIPIRLFAPQNSLESYKKAGVDVDAPLAIPADSLTAEDWIITFGFSPIDEYGILIERVIKILKTKSNFSMEDIIYHVSSDKKADQKVKDALTNRFLAAMDWDIFSPVGIPIEDLFVPGGISVIDISHFASTGG